jgi:hypothetical protein
MGKCQENSWPVIIKQSEYVDSTPKNFTMTSFKSDSGINFESSVPVIPVLVSAITFASPSSTPLSMGSKIFFCHFTNLHPSIVFWFFEVILKSSGGFGLLVGKNYSGDSFIG